MKTWIALAPLLVLAACASAPSDDAVCQSFGAIPGSDAYVSCRVHRESDRSARINALIDAPVYSPPPYVAPILPAPPGSTLPGY
ncbi:MAG: hypothetical protein WAU78_07830 [Roseiarcus sp.]